MNNEVNSNETNNFNGEVLGSVNNVNNNPVNNEIETLETLDTSMVMPVNNTENQVLESNVVMETESANVNSTPVTPEPAYTNPQNINPMPGFEHSNQIGTTPPISLEPEKEPKKKKSNKTVFILIIIILLFGIGFGTYYVLKYTDILSNAPKIVIETKNLEVNIGESISSDIKDYATVTGTDIKNCNIDKETIDSTKVGTYTYKITCGEVYKTGTVNVVDNTELLVNTENLYKVKGSTVEAKDFIVNPNEDYSYEIINNEEVKGYLNSDEGTYIVKIKATSGTKTKEVEAKLTIIKYEIKGYLVCSSNPQNLENSSTTKVLSERFAIVNDGNNSFGGVSKQSYIFKFSDETEYTNYLAEYKNKGTITIDNVTGQVEFNDTDLTITITNEKTKEEVIAKYGESNMVNYRSIRSYFINTLKYTCPYEEAK